MGSRIIRVHHGDYTVAVICALGLEMNAVRKLLDCSQGKSSAAIASTNLVRTFPNIKYRLLVGIGGGAPSARHDIRLGDVVVSMSTDQHGGVVQYDHGKDTESGFIRKGFTSPPPSVLRSAVYKMKYDQSYIKSNKDRLSQALELSVSPRPAEPDILFEVNYAHALGQYLCKQCDLTKIVHRPRRPNDEPQILHGLIASGNRVIKSAAKRDAISEDLGGDVLCFEMEAAGFIQEFPSVVIRGISDYADSHKNDVWQHYAAGTAAACARELLTYLEPEHKSPVTLPMFGESDEYSVQTATFDSRDLLEQFLADICETDPLNEMTRIRQSKGTLLAQCYTWIIQSPELQRWQTESDTRLLWMKGGPGKGKTMAMIGLVECLSDQTTPQDSTYLSYFFCCNGVSQLSNALSVLRGLIWKVLWANRSLCMYIPDEYRCKKDHGKDILDGPNAFAILTTMLCRVLEDETMGTVFLLVDALDECDNGMYSLLDWIVNEASRPSTKGKWLLSSRHSPAFEDYFLSSHCMACRSLDYGEGCMSDAVNYSIKYKVKQLAERKNISLVLQKEIETELKAKAESTFLWVALVCQRLQWISRRRLKELKETPPGLELLYDRMLQQVENYDDEEDRDMCLRIISTVIIACCPLNFKELAIAAELPANIKEDIHQLVELCGSFFTVRHASVFLTHQSVKEYFCIGVGQRIFTHGVALEHSAVLERLLNAMNSRLSRNMYNIQYPGCSIDESITP